jgi:hypothetical protein
MATREEKLAAVETAFQMPRYRGRTVAGGLRGDAAAGAPTAAPAGIGFAGRDAGEAAQAATPEQEQKLKAAQENLGAVAAEIAASQPPST